MFGGLRRKMARSRDRKVKIERKNENEGHMIKGAARVVENVHALDEMCEKKRRVFDDADSALNAAGCKRSRCKATSEAPSENDARLGKAIKEHREAPYGKNAAGAMDQLARKQAVKSRALRNSENIDPQDDGEKSTVRLRATAKSRLPIKKSSKKEPMEIQPPKMLPPHQRKSNAELRKVISGMQDLLGKPPVGIETEDKRDSEASGKYAVHIVSYLQNRETKYVLDPHFLKDNEEITPCMRSVLTDWLIKVQNHLRLNQETLHQAVVLMDQYTNKQAFPLPSYQLLGISCLLISAKVEERFPPTIEKLCQLTDDTYRESQVLRMEREVLKTLKFDATPITAVYFTERLLHLLGDDPHPMMAPLCDYLLDLSIVDVNMVQCPASLKAAAVVCLARRIVATDTDHPSGKVYDGDWTPALRYFSTYSKAELEMAVRRLAKLLLRADKSKYTGAYEKFSSASMFLSVATWSKLSGPVVQSLAKDPLPTAPLDAQPRKIQVLTIARRPPAGQVQGQGQGQGQGKVFTTASGRQAVLKRKESLV